MYASGATKTDYQYPGWNKFSDEGGKGIKGNLIYFIEPGAASDAQADWFAPNTANGLTQAGLSRINQSIEAFVYCILGAQVNVRSSILGSGGRAGEAQSEFLVLMEDAIRQPDLAASVQRYQLAVDQAKVRLNLAVAPMAWFMPAQMIINTAGTIGYNNKLKQAVSGMKLGVNNEVSPDTKKAGLKLMAGGPSKINPPNSHPVNPIHKAATAESSRGKPLDPGRGVEHHRKPASTETQQAQPTAQKIEPTAQDKTPQHEINKTAVIVGVVGLSALLFVAWR